MTLFLKVLAILVGIASMFGYGYFGIGPTLCGTTLNLNTSDKYDMLSSICLIVFIVDMILIGIFS
jgi:hypothetical protein